jgi:short-subunit dehydrogenase
MDYSHNPKKMQRDRSKRQEKKDMSNSTSKGTAVVTGASRGIGAVYADRLAKLGYDLILVARSEAPLEALTASLASASGRHITAIVADLNNKVDLAKVEARLKEDSSITMLVNNAGIGAVVPLLNADIEQMEEIVDLNITALTRLTYAAAPAFVRRGRGAIINISSVVGISPETLNGVYGATKAYVLAFTHSLQHELADKGIRVQAVLPGATATDMWEIAGLPWQKLPPSIVMSVQDMVDAALAGLDQNELVTIPGLHDGDEWTRFEAARRAISQRFGNSVPAPRYKIQARRSA